MIRPKAWRRIAQWVRVRRQRDRQKSDRQQPQQRSQSLRIQPRAHHLVPAPERHSDQHADQQGDNQAQRQQIDHAGIVLRQRDGELVAQSHRDPENAYECAEHPEHAEVLGRIEPGQQRRSGQDEELTERGAADQDSNGALQPAFRQERPQDTHHEGRDRRRQASSLVVATNAKQAGPEVESLCADAHAYFSFGCHEAAAW